MVPLLKSILNCLIETRNRFFPVHIGAGAVLKMVVIGVAWFTNPLQSQFAPAAGKPGSTAIKADSSCFQGWANACYVDRGWRQINLKDSGYASVGVAANAEGKALSKGVVSLGDGGSAVLVFDPPIRDDDGFDFAVFENAFNDSFLELAFVEVSTDSVRWARFPATSLTPIGQQTGGFGATNPTLIHNFAGKYRMPYGTPFDLQDLALFSFINPNNIRYVRIVDVIGSVDSALGSRDHSGNIVNDPFPTNFASSGFDLDAVGAIHLSPSMGNRSAKDASPCWAHYKSGNLHIGHLEGLFNGCSRVEVIVYSSSGLSVGRFSVEKNNDNTVVLPLCLSAGIYTAFIHRSNSSVSNETEDSTSEVSTSSMGIRFAVDF